MPSLCPNCQKSVEEAGGYCPHCGAILSQVQKGGYLLTGEHWGDLLLGVLAAFTGVTLLFFQLYWFEIPLIIALFLVLRHHYPVFKKGLIWGFIIGLGVGSVIFFLGVLSRCLVGPH